MSGSLGKKFIMVKYILINTLQMFLKHFPFKSRQTSLNKKTFYSDTFLQTLNKISYNKIHQIL